jgi:hypothetical protein
LASENAIPPRDVVDQGAAHAPRRR